MVNNVLMHYAYTYSECIFLKGVEFRLLLGLSTPYDTHSMICSSLQSDTEIFIALYLEPIPKMWEVGEGLDSDQAYSAPT